MKRLCTLSGVGVFALALTSSAVAQDGACCIPDAGDGSGETCVVTDQTDCETVQMGTYQGDGTDCSECSFENCVQSDEQCQEPNIPQFPGGTILTSAPTADNFVATTDGNITSVCFWGAYIDLNLLADCDDPLPGDSVTITFFPNIQSLPPQPDTAAGTTFNITTLTRRATDLEFGLGGFDDTVSEYEWTATLPGDGFPVTAGECVWISIENTVTSGNPDCAWFWEVGPEAVNEPDTGQGDDLSWDIDGATDNDFEMAWCLNLALDDTSGCFAPLNQNCGAPELDPGAGSCVTPDESSCQIFPSETDCLSACPTCTFTEGESCLRTCAIPNPFGEAGCLDAECCTLVCDGDPANPNFAPLPICCSLAWDQNCANAAISELGCVGAPLCGGEVDLANCQPFSTINAFNSTFNTVDGVGDFVAADDFSPAADGSVSNICWQGTLTDAAGAPVPDSLNFPNDFQVTYFADGGNGLPDTATVVGGPFSQSGGTLTVDSVADTNLTIGGTFPILEYTATHEPVALTGGECVWISIQNGVGADGTSWFWELAATSPEPPFYSGNGRMAIDGPLDTDGDGVPDTPPDGFDQFDRIGAFDFSVCFFDLGALSVPACGLDTLYNTGPEQLVQFDGGDAGNFADTFLGWSSGQLCAPNCENDTFPQRRTAQQFTLPPVPAALGAEDWHIRQIFADGFDPGGVNNEDLEFKIFTRTAGVVPTSDDVVVEGSFPYPLAAVGATHPNDDDPGEGFGGALHAIPLDFNLPPGDYYLTVFATNTTSLNGGQAEPSNFAWFTNAPGGINNTCGNVNCIEPTPLDQDDASVFGCDPNACDTAKITMLRGRNFPDTNPDDALEGFGSYDLDPATTLTISNTDPTPDADDLYNAAFMVRGNPGGGVCGDGVINGGEDCDDGNTDPGDGCSAICEAEPAPPCPWDCGDGDGTVGTPDFLALLGQWNDVGTSCDFDGGGVGTPDFLELLANWGDCPQ